MSSNSIKRLLIVILLAVAALGIYRYGYLMGPDPFSTAVYNLRHTPTDNEAYIEQLKLEAAPWGLGQRLVAYSSVDRPYPWYVDQGTTGIQSGDNCGPSVLAMAVKWYNPQSELSADWARLYYRPLGGWWYTDDIEAGLKRFEIPYQRVAIDGAQTLVDIIKADRIAIICNDMGSIPMGSSTGRANRFYDYDSGHFLIVKGFAQVDATLYFQVYDSNNWSKQYSDGTPMGLNRYYTADALIASIVSWHPYVYAIGRPTTEKLP